jgi:hypothetical protein
MRSGRLFRLIGVFCILSAFILTAFTFSNGDRIPLNGSQWLDGNGVDVLYPPKGSPVPIGYTTQCRYGGCYQCIELAIRLYAEKLGYDRCILAEFKDLPGCTDPTPNDVLHRWPGAPKADPQCPYSRNGSLWTPCDLRGMVRYANQAREDDNNFKLFKDLQYFDNGSTTPPRPGDILLYTYASTGDHTAVINRVGGNRLEIVEQNWPDKDSLGNLTARRMLEIKINEGKYWIANTMGWIHSPQMAKQLTVPLSISVPMINYPYFGNVQWNRDQETVYFYLSPEATNALGNDVSPSRQEAKLLVNEIAKTRALNLTETAYGQCILAKVADLIQNRFKLSETRSVDFTLKYTGTALWMRVWWKASTNSNSGWLPINDIRCGWDGHEY